MNWLWHGIIQPWASQAETDNSVELHATVWILLGFKFHQPHFTNAFEPGPPEVKAPASLTKIYFLSVWEKSLLFSSLKGFPWKQCHLQLGLWNSSERQLQRQYHQDFFDELPPLSRMELVQSARTLFILVKMNRFYNMIYYFCTWYQWNKMYMFFFFLTLCVILWTRMGLKWHTAVCLHVFVAW